MWPHQTGGQGRAPLRRVKGESHVDIWENIPGRMNSQCKGCGTGPHLADLRQIKKTKVAGRE